MSQQTDQSSDAAESTAAPLEGQIDALIDGFAQEPGDDAAAAASAAPALEGESDDPLADQIQEMLDAARQKQDESLADAAVAATDAETDMQPAELDELDTALAAEADDMLAGDFESVHEVLGTQAPAAQVVAAPPAAPAVEMPPLEREQDESEQEEEHVDGDFVEPDAVAGGGSESDLPVPAAAQSDALAAAPFQTVEQAETDIIDGDFAAPDDVAAEHRAPEPDDIGFTATDKDVAAELDRAAAPPPVRRAASPRPAAAPASRATAPPPPAAAPRGPRIHVAANLLHKTCCVISKPVASVNDEWRNIIGYAGVVTLFNFSVLMLYKLATVLLG